MSSSVIDQMSALAAMPLPPNQLVIAVMDKSGDTKLIFDKNVPAEVDNARATFQRLKEAGMSAYLVKGKDGEKGEAATSFSPEAERYIFAPRMKGG